MLDKTDNYRFVYVCGVANGPEKGRRCANLHFPLRYEAGKVADITTYNGYRFEAQNAVQVPMMRRHELFGYATGSNWRAVTLPYFGDRLATAVSSLGL